MNQMVRAHARRPIVERPSVRSSASTTCEDASSYAAMVSVAERLLDRIIGIALAARTVEARHETMTPELRYEILGLVCDRAWEIHMALAEQVRDDDQVRNSV